MTFIYHIIILGGLCFFGYTSNNSFELLISGIAGSIFGLILSTQLQLSIDVGYILYYVLSLKQDPSKSDRELSSKTNEWIIRGDWPKLAPQIIICLYVGVSCFLIIKSIVEMLYVI